MFLLFGIYYLILFGSVNLRPMVWWLSNNKLLATYTNEFIVYGLFGVHTLEPTTVLTLGAYNYSIDYICLGGK